MTQIRALGLGQTKQKQANKQTTKFNVYSVKGTEVT